MLCLFKYDFRFFVFFTQGAGRTHEDAGRERRERERAERPNGTHVVARPLGTAAPRARHEGPAARAPVSPTHQLSGKWNVYTLHQWYTCVIWF